jgi:glycosyltransferase involved in cell wall biosynthesis
MTYLSGSPLYHYTLAKELRSRGHEIVFVSEWNHNHLRTSLNEMGVQTVSFAEGEYDITIVSQQQFTIPPSKTVIHIIHSEYPCENPRQGLPKYVAIRPSIKEHLIAHHGIPAEKIEIIYNGVDLERFKPQLKTPRDYTKVVIPATRDPLRQKMFDYYTSRANEKFRIFIYGNNFGARIPQSPFITVHDETDEIEKHIGDADLVAGILLGRVNLEARAMDVKSYIHNPDNADDFYEYYPDRADFESKHDIKKVADQLLCLHIS